MNEARKTARLFETDQIRRGRRPGVTPTFETPSDDERSRFDDVMARGQARAESPRRSRFRLRWPTVYEWFVIGGLIAVILYLST